jgi:phage terminase large subunit
MADGSSFEVPKRQAIFPPKFRFLFDDGYRYKASHGGRGSAKSHSFAGALVLQAAMGSKRIICTREIQNSIKDSVKRLLDDKLFAYGLDENHGGPFRSTEREIRHIGNDSLFVFSGLRSNPSTVKSLEGADIAWVEESNTISVRSLDILRPTVRKPNSELWFTWNPELPSDPVDNFFRGNDPKNEHWAPPPRSIVVEAGFNDNPFFPEVLEEERTFDLRRDPEKYAWVWEGKYRKNSEARVFKNWRVEPFETPMGTRFYFGGDWGYANDPSVLVRCWIPPGQKKILMVDFEAYKIGCEIDKTPALFDQVPDSTKWAITADSARPETISYMQRHGYPKIRPALKGPSSVEDGIEFLKSYDIIVHPRCRHTIEEMTMYSWKQDPLTQEILPVLEDKNNHVIDSLRYAVEGIRRNTYGMMNVV